MDDLPRVKYDGAGMVHLMISVNVNFLKPIQEKVLDVPIIIYLRLPVGVRDRAGNSVLFDKGKCLIEDNKTINAYGQRTKDLYIF